MTPGIQETAEVPANPEQRLALEDLGGRLIGSTVGLKKQNIVLNPIRF